jgi:hypothetical protein
MSVRVGWKRKKPTGAGARVGFSKRLGKGVGVAIRL